MRASFLVTFLFIFKYSMENQNKSLFCGALFSLCGILEVCGIDLVGYIRFEIRTYLHGDPTDMRESTSVFQIRTINWSKLDK